MSTMRNASAQVVRASAPGQGTSDLGPRLRRAAIARGPSSAKMATSADRSQLSALDTAAVATCSAMVVATPPGALNPRSMSTAVTTVADGSTSGRGGSANTEGNLPTWAYIADTSQHEQRGALDRWVSDR